MFTACVYYTIRGNLITSHISTNCMHAVNIVVVLSCIWLNDTVKKIGANQWPLESEHQKTITDRQKQANMNASPLIARVYDDETSIGSCEYSFCSQPYDPTELLHPDVFGSASCIFSACRSSVAHMFILFSPFYIHKYQS